MAIAANDSLIVNKEGAPIDARTVAPTLEALAEIENPYVGLRVFVTETGREYRVTEIEDVAIGAFTKKQIKTYEALPDAAALEDTFAVIQNLTENHSLEIGFDNAPLETENEVTDDDGNTVYQTDESGEQILDDEGNPIPETETERAFQCFVRGSNNKYGSSVTIDGDNNENSLGFVRIYGSNNKTYQFQNIFGDLNELTASVNVTVFGNSNKDNGVNANGAVIIGNLNEVTAANTFTAGYRVKNFAKGARAIGRYYTLEDTPENEYAFALGDGELDGTTPKGEISLIHRVFKAVENPLFNPADLSDDSDASDPNPKDSSGERKYIAERAYATEYRGHWLAVTRNVDTAGTVTLDHDQYARWNLTASGTVTLALSNWKDGDSGELIVDTTKQTINIPADWVTLGADITTTPGVYVLEIAQVGSKIFYQVKYAVGVIDDDPGGGDIPEGVSLCKLVGYSAPDQGNPIAIFTVQDANSAISVAFGNNIQTATGAGKNITYMITDTSALENIDVDVSLVSGTISRISTNFIMQNLNYSLLESADSFWGGVSETTFDARNLPAAKVIGLCNYEYGAFNSYDSIILSDTVEMLYLTYQQLSVISSDSVKDNVRDLYLYDVNGTMLLNTLPNIKRLTIGSGTISEITNFPATVESLDAKNISITSFSIPEGSKLYSVSLNYAGSSLDLSSLDSSVFGLQIDLKLNSWVAITFSAQTRITSVRLVNSSASRINYQRLDSDQINHLELQNFTVSDISLFNGIDMLSFWSCDITESMTNILAVKKYISLTDCIVDVSGLVMPADVTHFDIYGGLSNITGLTSDIISSWLISLAAGTVENGWFRIGNLGQTYTLTTDANAAKQTLINRNWQITIES